MNRIQHIGSVWACLLLAIAPVSVAATKLPEGTDVRLQVTEKLSSATATEGQRFGLSLDEDVQVGGIVVVPRGAKAVGTVINARKRGHMGKAGELNIQINYLLVGDQRVPLRASSGRQGDSKVGATVALTVLFGPLGLLKRGKDVELNPGVVLTAQVDQATDVNVGYTTEALQQTVVQSVAGASAIDNPSAPSAQQEMIKLGCSKDFAIVSANGSQTIFEATCESGKRQLIECHGSSCHALN